MRGIGAGPYEAPAVVASYAIAELVNDAISCSIYRSDEVLKDEITPIKRPLGGLRDPNPRTSHYKTEAGRP